MKGTLDRRFEKHARAFFPEFFSGEKVLLAFSGGVDSTVLGFLLKNIGATFDAAHCNFHLRGEESVRDGRFAQRQALDWGVKLFATDFDTAGYAKRKKISVEMAARELRYAWFEELVKENGYAGLAVAHHGDDQVETVLLNLTRGTSLDGLQGMKPRNGIVWRPLLPFSREEIEDFARENALEWVEDSTNATVDYTRNRLRHEVMPVLKQINPSLVASLYENTGYLRGIAGLYARLTEEKAASLLSCTDHGGKINIAGLRSLGEDASALLYGILKRYGLETRTEDVMESIFSGQSGAEFSNGKYRLLRDRDFLFVEPADILPCEGVFKIPQGAQRIETPVGLSFSLSDKQGGQPFDPGASVAYFDAEKLEYPLSLRRMRPGDVFAPLGMNGRRKKISKLLKDEKMPVVDKQRIWLLCSASGQIAWVVGLRSCEEFRVTEETKRVLVVRVSGPGSCADAPASEKG